MSRIQFPLGMILLVCFAQSVNAQNMGEEFTGGVASGVYGANGSETLYPYDSNEPWLHGYWQEMPYFGGFAHFRPYNYRHVLSQSQTAAGWGMNPKMPYSQQFWHPYHQQASLAPSSGYQPVPAMPTMPAAPMYQAPQQYYVPGNSYQAPTYGMPGSMDGMPSGQQPMYSPPSQPMNMLPQPTPAVPAQQTSWGYQGSVPALPTGYISQPQLLVAPQR